MFHVMTGDKDKLLNERNELITKFRNVDKFLLRNFKSRQIGRGRGGGEDDDVFPVGIFCYFLYDHVCHLITSYFILN